MNYLPRFGLRALPFRSSPDTAFLYPSTGYAAALESLRRLNTGSGGVTLMTGPSGVGKTTLVDRLVLDLPTSTAVARLDHGLPSTIALLQGLLIQFGYAPYHLTRSELASALWTFLSERNRLGERALIAIDEAQRLDSEALAELLNIVLAGTQRLDVLLIGNVSLLARFDDAAIAPLASAVTQRIRLHPLRPDELARYLQHRLDAAGASGRRVFDDAAVDRLLRVTGGLPKFINTLADHAMAAADQLGRDIVTSDDVLAASRHLSAGEIDTERADDAIAIETAHAGATSPEAPDSASASVRPASSSIAVSEPSEGGTDTVIAVVPSFSLKLLREGVIVHSMILSPGEFTIGRTRENDLQIESRFVSRRHCRLHLEFGRLTIEDLSSTNGLVMGGEPVRRRELKSGDVVQIGIHELHIDAVGTDE